MNNTQKNKVDLAVNAAKNDSKQIDLKNAANIAGQTPTYIYSRSLLKHRIDSIKEYLPETVALHYSVKANPLPQLVSYISRFVDGLDVSSHTEMLLAFGTELPPECISFSGPGKNDSELLAAITAGVTVHVESIYELHRLIDISESIGIDPRVALRINPPFSVKRSGMIMGGGSQQFGIDLEQADSVLSYLTHNNISCTGIHCYSASQMLDENIIADVQNKTIDMAIKLIDKHGLTDVSINIGGGLGVPYFANENELNLNYIGDALGEKLNEIDFNGKVILELGRYIVAGAGVYIARIVDKKISRGKVFLILNGGLNHHLAATGNLGQVIRKNFPITTSSNSIEIEKVSIVGPLCTPLDILGEDLELPSSNVGDLIAVHQSGAYGYSASPHHFLGHKCAVEVLIP